ncbi:MAG TPA: TRAP transporter large permease subunit, partial [Methylomirabilota bacterium]|nr:TRAP transporter large permease subunit [Methylomirabilota bacterium]
VLSLNLSPLGFMFLAQLIIFLLGWPLEWTEIIVIFVPIFIPLLAHFQIDPILFGTMVAVNLQAAFLSPLGFQFTAQLIIFLLGWPLEWTEIIVIFCPIFIPLLSHFQIDPILFGTMVAVNLQAAFLSPPVAMSAFYLKGVAPKHVTLNQIFAGMMPYMIIVCICLAFMYIWPGMTLWLPEFLYGK